MLETRMKLTFIYLFVFGVALIKTNTAEEKADNKPQKAQNEVNATLENGSIDTNLTTASPSISTKIPTDDIGNWHVTENNTTCIIIHGNLTIKLVNLKNNDVNMSIHVPANAVSNGSCHPQAISLIFDKNSNLTLTFSNNAKEYYIKGISGEIYHLNSTKVDKFENETMNAFSTPLGNSYQCLSNSEFVISNTYDNKSQYVLQLSQFHMQAFKTSNSKDFDSAIDCATKINTSDIVPIIVACALAILVIAVLVAYLISRNRSQDRGYVSM